MKPALVAVLLVVTLVAAIAVPRWANAQGRTFTTAPLSVSGPAATRTVTTSQPSVNEPASARTFTTAPLSVSGPRPTKP